MIRPLSLALALLVCGNMLAGEVQTDPPGAPERKPILDALRAEDSVRGLSADWKSPIVFSKVTIRRSEGWAWVQASPGTPDGQRSMEPLNAVLHKVDGQWQFVDFVSDEVAPADDPDAAFRKWQKAFLGEHPKCPAAIFPARF